MVGRLLVGFVRLNLQFSGSRLSTFRRCRVAQSLLFCLMVGRILVGSCGSIFCFLCHDWWTFSGVRVAQSFVFCVMVGRLLVGFVCLNLQISVSWQATFNGVRVAQSLVFYVMVGRLLLGFVCLNLQFSVSQLVVFQWGSCGSIFSFLCHGWQTFSGVRVAQSLVFCVMVGRLLVRLLWFYLQFSVSWLVDFQWGSCGSIFSFVLHGWQTFSGVRVAQSLVFCVMVGRLLVGFVWLNLLFSVSWLVDFQWGSCDSIFSFVLSWQVDFQWGSCTSIFSFLYHGWQTFSGVRVAQSLVFCVMVGRLLVGFVWLNLQFSVAWLVDFQLDSCGSIFCFLCHGWETFSGVRVAQSVVFCAMVGILLVGFVWLNLQFSASWQVDFYWGSCGSIFSFLCHGMVDFQWGSCGSIFSFLCHGWQTFSGVRVAQSLVLCFMVGRLLWGSCGSICSFLCHGWQTFSVIRVAQSLVFCVMVGRLLVGLL